MKLSVAIAVHNEEKNIARCVDAVYSFAHEIIIVDGASTDNTVGVIKSIDPEKKIKLFHEQHEVIFHKNKQKAIERCKGDWILQLDADEIVSDELIKEIQTITTNQSGNNVAYWIPRLNFFLGKPLKKGGQYPDYTIRLYKNGVAKFPCKSVHEQVEIAKPSAHNDTFIGYLKSDLLHYPYPTFKEYLDKWARYALLEAEILYKKGARPSLSNHLLYFVWYPKLWFLKTYFRHLGLADGFAGFVFSLFSALRYIVTYCKLYELNSHETHA